MRYGPVPEWLQNGRLLMYVDEAMLALDCMTYRNDPRSMSEGMAHYEAELNTLYRQWELGLKLKMGKIPKDVPMIGVVPVD